MTGSGNVLNEQQSPSSVICNIDDVYACTIHFYKIQPETGIGLSISYHALQKSNAVSSRHMVRLDPRGSGVAVVFMVLFSSFLYKLVNF